MKSLRIVSPRTLPAGDYGILKDGWHNLLSAPGEDIEVEIEIPGVFKNPVEGGR